MSAFISPKQTATCRKAFNRKHSPEIHPINGIRPLGIDSDFLSTKKSAVSSIQTFFSPENGTASDYNTLLYSSYSPCPAPYTPTPHSSPISSKSSFFTNSRASSTPSDPIYDELSPCSDSRSTQSPSFLFSNIENHCNQFPLQNNTPEKSNFFSSATPGAITNLSIFHSNQEQRTSCGTPTNLESLMESRLPCLNPPPLRLPPLQLPLSDTDSCIWSFSNSKMGMNSRAETNYNKGPSEFIFPKS